MSTSIKKIYIYPIKSLAGIELEKCYITKHGISHPLNKQVVDRYILHNEQKNKGRENYY